MGRMANHRKTVRTVSDVLKALGGLAGAAKFCGVGQSCVANWKAAGVIPSGWHLRMYLHLEHQGYIVLPSAFGVDVDELPTSARRWARKVA
jgi:hypothetical protein